MKKSTTAVAVVLATLISGCGEDITTSDEYRQLEQEVVALETRLEEATPDAVPADVVALLDEFDAANERGDGSVADLYRISGYHLYGDQKIERDEIAAHLGASGWTHEWITEPYLIAAEPEGRYVVARGLRNSNGAASYASALTFELITSVDGELEIAQSAWTKVHR